jgi:hypothetical protein
MFDNWGITEWFILVIDIAAIIIVVRFLTNKVKTKLAEVEARHAFETQRRKTK